MHDLQHAHENGTEHSKAETNVLKLREHPTWIDTEVDLRALQNELEQTSCVKIVGLDSEWYDAGQGSSTQIATFQVAYKKTTLSAFVIDMIAEFKSTEYMKAVREFVIWLFDRYFTVGFAFRNDMKLLSAFAGEKLKPVSLDVQTMMTNSKKHIPGLKTCVARFSSVPLSKTEQCSEWSRRPLTQSQLQYAGLDASILLVLLAEYQREKESLQHLNDDTANNHNEQM